MGNGLYDTGKPQRIIVEKPDEEIPQALQDGVCPRSPGWSCSFVRREHGFCVVCPYRPQAKVTIMPQFLVVKEPKRLK